MVAEDLAAPALAREPNSCVADVHVEITLFDVSLPVHLTSL